MMMATKLFSMACVLLLALAPGGLLTSLEAQVAIRAETIHTVSGGPIRKGIVVVTDGKIAAVGPAAEVAIPIGYEILEARVLTPGLIDARSVVGLAGIYNRDQDQDQVEKSEPIQPELRALDAYNRNEKLVAWLRGFGITTINTGHAPAALVPGQAMVVKTREAPLSETVMKADSMVLATLGDSARGAGGKSPGTPAKMMAMLRQNLIEAADYARKRVDPDESKRPPRDLGKDALARVLARELPLTITAHRDRDILAALRLAAEFDFVLILDGASEIRLCLDEVKAAGIPVIIHPPMARTNGEHENASFETPAELAETGILFAFQSGYESYVPKTRVVLFEAAIAAANGLSFDRALRAITLDAAKLLGIADRVGSIEVGKDADLVLFDGDPFEYTSHVLAVICDGEVVSREKR